MDWQAIIIVFIVIGIPVICGTLIILVKILKGGSGSSRNSSSEEETRLIQEIYTGLTKLDSRIESLETIVLENERKKPNE